MVVVVAVVVVIKTCCSGCAVPSPTVTCTGEMITASFARSVNRLLAAEYLSVASYYAGPTNNCSYETSEETDYVIIAFPFVGGGCDTTREVW